MRRSISLLLAVVWWAPSGGTRGEEIAGLDRVSPEVLSEAERSDAGGMIERDLALCSAAVNARNRADWAMIDSREAWEAFRDQRLAKLRRSLGEFPEPPTELKSRVTGLVDGNGFRIENVVYESRPGFWVTANLYVPAAPADSMPGILIAHSHHRDKFHSELQDMGMTWARAGCLVLVIDQVGYGERRAHPFHRAEDFPRPFPTSRQDYRFRYDNGVQLHLLGDSLMGWMTWDLSRGVDLLLARDGIDPKRILLLGSVAGGGDPAGVTAALDKRITACVPFNFGGPQPESKYPLPDDAEQSFDLLGGTYWDSTRGLRLGGRDDFLHWVIVAGTAPRHLIHAHEFTWDGERDPVWRRYQRVWGDFYGAADRIGVAHGYGTLRQDASQASHCTHIGRAHRKMIHPLFKEWFGIEVDESDEYSKPRTNDALRCWTDAARAELQPRTLNEVMTELAVARIERARGRLKDLPPAERRRALQAEWTRCLGPVTPSGPAKLLSSSIDTDSVNGAAIERIVLEVEPDLVVPLIVLRPAGAGRRPVVVGVAQEGKAGFLVERGNELRRLLDGGAMVVLPDLRGTGETRAGSSRGLDSAATNQSVHVQLFGETLVGQRLRDLRSVLAWLRTRGDVDPERIALWGESFAPTNSTDAEFRVPHSVAGRPGESEPLGGLLALLGGLFEPDLRGVYLAGGLNDFASVLTHFAVFVPHDAAVPGAIAAGDLGLLAEGVTPTPLRIEATVDHLNRPATADALLRIYAPSDSLEVEHERTSSAMWLMERLRSANSIHDPDA